MDNQLDLGQQAIFPGQRSIILPRPVLGRATGIAADLLPTDIGYYPKAAGHMVERPAGIPQIVLIYCVGGSGRVRNGARWHQVKPGDLAVLPPHTGHAYAAGPLPWTIYWLHAAGNRTAEYARLLQAGMDGPVFSLRDDPGFVSAFEEIFQVLDQGYGPDQLLLAGTALARLLSRLAVGRRLGRLPGEAPLGPVETVIAWMRRNLSAPITVPELAAMARLSVSQFAALFKRETGYPVLDYFIRLKMSRACHLLDSTQLSVKEIARDLGFEDPLYFSRRFRAVYGQAPRDYRAVRKG